MFVNSSVLVIVLAVFAMFTVLALAGLPLEAVVTLGTSSCLVAGELVRRLSSPGRRDRRRSR